MSVVSKLCLGCGLEKAVGLFVNEAGNPDTQCNECRHTKNVKEREAAKVKRHTDAIKHFILQAKNPDTPVLDLATLTATVVKKLGGMEVFTQSWADMIEHAKTAAMNGKLSPKVPLDAYMSIGRLVIATGEQQKDEDVSAMSDEQLRSVIETLSASTELRLADTPEIEEDDEAEGLHAHSA